MKKMLMFVKSLEDFSFQRVSDFIRKPKRAKIAGVVVNKDEEDLSEYGDIDEYQQAHQKDRKRFASDENKIVFEKKILFSILDRAEDCFIFDFLIGDSDFALSKKHLVKKVDTYLTPMLLWLGLMAVTFIVGSFFVSPVSFSEEGKLYNTLLFVFGNFGLAWLIIFYINRRRYNLWKKKYQDNPKLLFGFNPEENYRRNAKVAINIDSSVDREYYEKMLIDLRLLSKKVKGKIVWFMNHSLPINVSVKRNTNKEDYFIEVDIVLSSFDMNSLIPAIKTHTSVIFDLKHYNKEDSSSPLLEKIQGKEYEIKQISVKDFL